MSGPFKIEAVLSDGESVVCEAANDNQSLASITKKVLSTWKANLKARFRDDPETLQERLDNDVQVEEYRIKRA